NSESSLKQSRYGGPNGAPYHSRHNGQGQVDKFRQIRKGKAHPGRGKGANVKLAFCPNIKQPSPKRKGHSQSSKHQGRGSLQRCGKAAHGAKRLLKQHLVRIKWALSHRQDKG